MSKLTNTPAADILHTQMNVSPEENNSSSKSEELVKRIPVDGTPITLISIDNDGWFAALGKYRISSNHVDHDTLRNVIMHIPWEILIATINVVILENNDRKTK